MTATPDPARAGSDVDAAFEAFAGDPGEACYCGSCHYCFKAGFRAAEQDTLADTAALRARAERAEAAIRAFLTGHEAPDWYVGWSDRYEALKAFIAAPAEPEGGA